MNEPVLVTLLVIDVFEMLAVPYLIGGSFASTAYGRVRTTKDVDIIASMRLNHVGGFIKAIEPGFYVDENMIHMVISRLASCQVV